MIFDVTIVGAGFYGCSLAILFADAGKSVCLVERESDIMSRASAINQARVHNGYHYPRSLPTALRSQANFPKFCMDYKPAIVSNFTKIYAIAKQRSKLSSKQFSKFCKVINSPLKQASDQVMRLFNPQLIENAFEVEEYAFDFSIIRELIRNELNNRNVSLYTGVSIRTITSNGTIRAIAENVDFKSRILLNCTYSQLNFLLSPDESTALKHEIAEIALIHPPAPIETMGITVMDGPFFSVMPFPSQKAHSLTHVRYTPHLQWRDQQQTGDTPYNMLDSYGKISRYRHMIADACRYIPSLKESAYSESLYEVKTVLNSNEIDDGRPILFKKHQNIPYTYSILGGKIDNIYDIFQKVTDEGLLA